MWQTICGQPLSRAFTCCLARFKEGFAFVQAVGDAVGLFLGAHCRGVSGQIAGSGDQPGRTGLRWRQGLLAKRCLDGLDGMEIPSSRSRQWPRTAIRRSGFPLLHR